MALAREWYDGYRFGSVAVYNPWSVLSFFDNRCMPGAYWGNTSGNGVLGDMVKTADEATLGKLYRLLEPGGTVEEPLDLSVVFPDVGVREEALWSMLYLAGYLTTSDVTDPSDTHLPASFTHTEQGGGAALPQRGHRPLYGGGRRAAIA